MSTRSPHHDRAIGMLARAAALFRIGGLVQIATALSTVWSQYRHPLAALCLALAVGSESTVVVWWWLRRRRVEPRWLAADITFCAAALLADAWLVLATAVHSWAFFMYPFTLIVCVGIGAGYQRLWQVLAGATGLASAYLVAALVIFAEPAWNAGPDALSYAANSVVTWLVARELRRSGRVADAHEADALARAAELAREREAARYTRLLHDRVLQTMEMLAKGDWLADRDIRSLVMEEAAWLRDVVTGDGTGDAAGDGAGDLLTGLRAVVRDQARRGIHVELNDSALRDATRRGLVPPPVAEAVCGAVREAVTNVHKHSGVDEAVVRAVLDPYGTALRVSIVDHGKGFDPQRVAQGTGLAHSVRGRMAQVGGTARVDSAPGCGTEVQLSVPLHPPVGRPVTGSG
jgi:signal transduction histidine kinase